MLVLAFGCACRKFAETGGVPRHTLADPVAMPLLRGRLVGCASRATTIRLISSDTTSFSTNPLAAYRRASRRAPLATAFATCWFKGSASDVIAQTQLEKSERVDWRRNFAFGFFSAAYLGIGQHLVYNIAFTRIFGTSTDLITALQKVAADSAVHVPMIYLPLYYAFKAVALGEGEGTAMSGLEQYCDDFWPVMTTYVSMWPVVHLISFTVMPVELRIGFVACVSFCWLIYLSHTSHGLDGRPGRARVLGDDGAHARMGEQSDDVAGSPSKATG
jgi:hypothetical protein